MRTPALLILLAAGAGAVATAQPPVTLANADLQTSAASPAAAVRSTGADVAWIAWSEPMVAGDRDVCCFSGDGRSRHGRGCPLEGRTGFTMSDDRPAARPPFERELLVLVRAQRGSATEVRAFSGDCPIDAGKRRLVWLDNVDGDESIRFLRVLVTGRTLDGALPALALHRQAEAGQVLEELAARPGDAREDAIFWLGEARGRSGLEALRRLLAARPDSAARKEIAFAFAQSEQQEALDDLIAMAHHDPSEETRGEALFWLGQHGGERAEGELLRTIQQDAAIELRKKAVFALSQLESGRSTPLLLGVLKSKVPAEIRREALFWLGQSDDPKAQEALEAVLLR
ncbi:MAG: HEAT repeat domain-containing protein [Acidobacteriota bacterium]